jgi:drug/metabolite transporter (DMT)-like permease
MQRQDLAVQGTLVAAMAIWGLNLTAVKLLTQTFEPSMVAALRMVVAAAALTGIVLWQRGAPWLPSGRQAIAIFLCAVLMVYMNQIFFAQGILRSTATNAALIMALSPLVSSLIAALAFRERVTTRHACGVALGFGGVAAVILSHPAAGLSHAGTGDLLLMGGVVSFACGGAIVQRLARQVSPLAISWAIYFIGSLMLIVQALADGSLSRTPTLFPGWWTWALVVFSGVMATAFSNLAWNGAIARIGVARTAVFLYWVPIFGVAFAALLLRERLTWWHLVGFVAVMAGTWLGTHRSTDRPRHGRTKVAPE